MTREEIIECLDRLLTSRKDPRGDTPIDIALKEAIKALEQEPCEDAISRETVLRMQYRIDDSATLATRDVVNVEDILELPSIQPKVKTGHWVLGGYDEHYYICNRCKFVVAEYYVKPKFRYCPNCGAKMVEPQESEEV